MPPVISVKNKNGVFAKHWVRTTLRWFSTKLLRRYRHTYLYCLVMLLVGLKGLPSSFLRGIWNCVKTSALALLSRDLLMLSTPQENLAKNERLIMKRLYRTLRRDSTLPNLPSCGISRCN